MEKTYTKQDMIEFAQKCLREPFYQPSYIFERDYEIKLSQTSDSIKLRTCSPYVYKEQCTCKKRYKTSAVPYCDGNCEY